MPRKFQHGIKQTHWMISKSALFVRIFRKLW
jgi:hypothetical protein